MNNKTGTIKQIVGVVVDVFFEGGVPDIQNALQVKTEDSTITLEVAQHLGLDRVRCIAMQDTAKLARGMEVVDTGEAISVPVVKSHSVECLTS